jgi:hypothetical protein
MDNFTKIAAAGPINFHTILLLSLKIPEIYGFSRSVRSDQSLIDLGSTSAAGSCRYGPHEW